MNQKYLKVGHLDFVPPSLVFGDEEHKVDSRAIYVYSHKSNNRILKRKVFHVGAILFNSKVKKPSFIMVDNVSLSTESMMLISSFMLKLERKIIKYDFKKGEFE